MALFNDICYNDTIYHVLGEDTVTEHIFLLDALMMNEALFETAD